MGEKERERERETERKREREKDMNKSTNTQAKKEGRVRECRLPRKINKKSFKKYHQLTSLFDF